MAIVLRAFFINRGNAPNIKGGLHYENSVRKLHSNTQEYQGKGNHRQSNRPGQRQTDFAHYDEPDDIFALDIRMLRQAALLLQKMQAKPVIVSTARDREYIDYICPRCRDTITQCRKGQKEGLYRPRYHDSCGQRLCWEKLIIKGKLIIKNQEATK